MKTDIAGLYSHEETGNGFTYQRDRCVAKWARQMGKPWLQFPQNGVVRPLKNRNGWAELRQKRMNAPIAPTPTSMSIPNDFDWGRMPSGEDLGLAATQKKNLQVGGEFKAIETLDSFLNVRGINYRKGMSSPVSAHENCSRLSPYFAWGCMSMKFAYQKLLARRAEIREAQAGSFDSRWLGSLHSFSSRLAWHCHFMQKLEDEPELEFQNISRVYEGLRENDFSQERFEAWFSEETRSNAQAQKNFGSSAANAV